MLGISTLQGHPNEGSAASRVDEEEKDEKERGIKEKIM